MDSAKSHWIPPPCIPCAPLTRINLMQDFYFSYFHQSIGWDVMVTGQSLSNVPV